MRKLIAILVWTAATLNAAHADEVLTGQVTRITPDFLVMDSKVYPLRNGRSMDKQTTDEKTTQCWVMSPQRFRLSCQTLAGVGYIDEARVTVVDAGADEARGSRAVTKVEVLNMKQ